MLLICCDNVKSWMTEDPFRKGTLTMGKLLGMTLTQNKSISRMSKLCTVGMQRVNKDFTMRDLKQLLTLLNMQVSNHALRTPAGHLTGNDDHFCV